MDRHQEFFQSLSPEEQQLIIMRDFLYEGEWDEIVRDLEARKEGRPFIFKLNTRIEEDLERIRKLREYEVEHDVDLGVYLVESGIYPELSGVLPDRRRPGAPGGPAAGPGGRGRGEDPGERSGSR